LHTCGKTLLKKQARDCCVDSLLIVSFSTDPHRSDYMLAVLATEEGEGEGWARQDAQGTASIVS